MCCRMKREVLLTLSFKWTRVIKISWSKNIAMPFRQCKRDSSTVIISFKLSKSWYSRSWSLSWAEKSAMNSLSCQKTMWSSNANRPILTCLCSALIKQEILWSQVVSYPPWLIRPPPLLEAAVVLRLSLMKKPSPSLIDLDVLSWEWFCTK